MTENPRRSRRTSTAMPPYRGVLALDAERYSQTSSRHQGILSGTIPEVLEEAFRRSGLESVWAHRSFPQRTGDGYLVGVPPEDLPLLIDPLLGELQSVLAEVQPGLAFEDRGLRLRLRAAIGVGPLPDSGGDDGDGVGTAMNETHRVLDAPVLRTALAGSDPDITFLAAGLTQRVYEDAVLGGYVGLPARRFTPADITLAEKDFRARAYLHTPVPSSRPADETGQTGAAGAVGGDSGRTHPDSGRPPRVRRGTVVFEAVPDA